MTSRGSADGEEVDDEDERLTRLDGAAGAPVAVAQVGRDDELAAAADLHALHALVPAGDDLADTEAERQRLAPVVRRVELLPGGVSDADVVHLHRRPRRRLRPLALGQLGDLELAR